MKQLIKSNEQKIEAQLKTGKERVAMRLGYQAGSVSCPAVIKVDFMYVTDLDKECLSSASFYGNYSQDKHHYKNLQVEALLPNTRNAPWEPEINFSTQLLSKVTLEETDRMVRTLRPIMRSLQKIEREEGYTDSFEEMMVRIATVMKVKSFFFPGRNPSHAKRCDDMEKFREALKSLIEIVKRESGFNADKAA